MKLVLLEVCDSLLEPRILQIESLLFKLEIKVLLLCLKELLLQNAGLVLLVGKVPLKLLYASLTALFNVLALGDAVHGLTHQHLHLVSLIAQFLSQ